MLVHLMTWNPTSKTQGEEVVMVIFYKLHYWLSIVTIKNICIYQKNDSITRHDLLLQNMDNYKHVDTESKCVCCDICLKTCACGLCNENNSFFFFFRITRSISVKIIHL